MSESARETHRQTARERETRREELPYVPTTTAKKLITFHA